MEKTSVVWFRQDLRLEDNLALRAAFEFGKNVVPVFIWSEEEEKPWAYGGASKWWLHHSLLALQARLEEIGLNLIIQKGNSVDVLKDLVEKSNAQAIFWNRRYEPGILQRDAKVKAVFKTQGVNCEVFNSALLFEPWTIFNKQKRPYQRFAPFWNVYLKSEFPQPLPSPKNQGHQTPACLSLKIKELKLLPKIHWDAGIQAKWKPGEIAAKKQLRRFLKQGIENYHIERNFPARAGTSQLSPHLRFGEISPRMIWHELQASCDLKKAGPECFLKELGWREFSYYLLYHFPYTTSSALKEPFNAFPWKKNSQLFKAWQKGLTGYPIIDAGMRQLWQIGWMHNRVRMIVGSFLVKDLLTAWQEGTKWFWDTLVDADLANNTLGWQWIGGCGADASPYFRVFNPVTQGQSFDPEGEYVKQWIKELKNLPTKWIHCPWKAPQAVLQKAGIELGKDYPWPIVDHEQARDIALSAFRKIVKKH